MKENFRFACLERIIINIISRIVYDTLSVSRHLEADICETKYKSNFVSGSIYWLHSAEFLNLRLIQLGQKNLLGYFWNT